MNADGSSELQPLRLEGIKVDSFRVFLKIMHTPYVFKTRKELAPSYTFCSQYHEKIALPENSWIAVLDLAHMWGFSGIEQLSIKELEALDVDAILKFELARKYAIESWLRPAFEIMTGREEPLTDDEVQRLGWRLASQIGRIREARYRTYIGHITDYIKVLQCVGCGKMHKDALIRPSPYYPAFGQTIAPKSPTNCTDCGNALEETTKEHTFTKYIARTKWEDIDGLLQST